MTIAKLRNAIAKLSATNIEKIQIEGYKVNIIDVVPIQRSAVSLKFNKNAEKFFFFIFFG